MHKLSQRILHKPFGFHLYFLSAYPFEVMSSNSVSGFQPRSSAPIDETGADVTPREEILETIDPDITDALIDVVSQQIELLTFDPDDSALMSRLIDSCADPREEMRLQLVELFGEIGEESTPVLVHALSNHHNPLVRRVCAKALARLGDPEAIPVLIQALLNDTDPITQSSASGALARMGEAAVPALLDVVESPAYPDAQKGQAVWALSCLGESAADQLYAAAKADSANVRCAVMGAIASLAKYQHPPSSGINMLLDGLNDPIAAVRLEAASGLGALRYYNATPDLVPLLSDSDPEIRKTTALALGSLKDPASFQALQNLLTDPSDVVRPVIQWAIQQVQAP